MSDTPNTTGSSKSGFPADMAAVSFSELLAALDIEVDADLAAKLAKDGQAVSRYQIDEKLSEIGDEQLLLATDISCERKIHIQVPAKGAPVECTARFVERMRLLRTLNHPTIPAIIDLGVDRDGRPYAVTAAPVGRSLSDILHASKTGDVTMQRRYPLPRLLDIFVQICEGISHAHTQGIIHLNLNPSDIFIGDNGEVAIGNWRNAREAQLFANDEEHLKTSGRGDWKVETQEIQQPESNRALPYLAPEQVLGRTQDIRLWTDIYSLGAVLYYMITLRPPVEADTPEDLLKRVARGEIADPSLYSAERALVAEMSGKQRGPEPNRHYSKHKQIPESLSAVVMKALAPRPMGRYESALGLRREIDAHRDGHNTREEEATFERESVEVLGQHQFRSRIMWMVIGLVALALIVVFGLSANEMVKMQESTEIAAAQRIAAERKVENLQSQLSVRAKPTPNIEAMLWDASSDESKLWRAAEAALLGALRMDDQNWRARYELGRVYLTQLDPKAAMLQFQLAKRAVSPYELEQIAMINRYIDFCRLLHTNLTKDGNVVATTTKEPGTTAAAAVPQPEPIEDDPVMLKLREVKTKLEAANPGVKLPERFFYIGDGTLDIEIADQPELRDISALTALPITSLSLWKTGVTDLSAIRNLPLKSLSLSQSGISDINALKGLPLESLDLTDSAVSDLMPLLGMKLQSLFLDGSNVSEISALRGMPLVSVGLSQTRITDISPLAGMQLTGLGLNGTRIGDLSVLKTMPLNILGLSGTPIRSIDDLQELPIHTLDLSHTAIDSIAALVGMPLKRLELSGCSKLKDLRLLAECPAIERLSVPNTILNISYLRKLPNLRYIDTKDAVTEADDFWKKYFNK
ncbi:MAG: serine/threonine protein kinase [Rhodothermales bacterium]|jgi:serine/threonine protein kinase